MIAGIPKKIDTKKLIIKKGSKWEKELEKICEDYWMEKLGLADGSEYLFLKKLIPFIHQTISQERDEVLTDLYYIRANIPLTDGMFARGEMTKLIEKLEGRKGK